MCPFIYGITFMLYWMPTWVQQIRGGLFKQTSYYEKCNCSAVQHRHHQHWLPYHRATVRYPRFWLMKECCDSQIRRIEWSNVSTVIHVEFSGSHNPYLTPHLLQFKMLMSHSKGIFAQNSLLVSLKITFAACCFSRFLLFFKFIKAAFVTLLPITGTQYAET